MKSIQVEFEKDSNKITIKEDAQIEDWPDVCAKYDDDVSRVCDVADQEDYTGVFECFDDHNNSFFYLVKEDKKLYQMKHKHFYDNLGLK